MVTPWTILLVTFLATLPESRSASPTILSESDTSVLTKVSVFETGKFHPITSHIGSRFTCSPPKPLLIVRPKEDGTYPVILFHHGTAFQNSWYTDVLKFISSHGYIVVAPQLYQLMPPSGQRELDLAAKVANWLPLCLQCVLPENIEGDLHNLALAGHSRGGFIAFALALGHADVSPDVNFSALIGVDPVAGISKQIQIQPKILNHESCSFDLPIPVAVIGSGLGNKPVLPFPPLACAPDGVSHTEFFNECKPPCSHFVPTDYGHMDFLDDDIGPIGSAARLLCKQSKWWASRDLLRRTAGGVIVAFLEAFFKGNYTDYNKILLNPYLAPATLDPVQNKSKGTSCSSLSAMTIPAFAFE
ncbi:unnamed protein product [Dovyalis caffra]|uniref:Chlorophyllase n=1 Tax=Dovyalis caffra TaxID=77055 RepID=A0AAV1S6L3_9ROSI|nr:unnamed protein product [Dovyalis caffra]